ncbi:MAG: RNA methyltransferase [Bacteroidales bacterium]|nr:RNA methyltransferase [Bacteroidales bacterium]
MEVGKRIDLLMPFVNDNRVATLRGVLGRRTRRVTVALENIYHSQNASAVVRSCDCFGIQDITIIENSSQFRASNGVARGAFKWLTYNRFSESDFNTPAAYDFLRSRGYKIVAASPHPGHDVSLYNLDVTESPIAVVFGAEKLGLSEWAMKNADLRMVIPMCGLTESLNISASAAITMSHLRRQIDEKLTPEEIRLSDSEQAELFSHWLLASIRDARCVLERVIGVK